MVERIKGDHLNSRLHIEFFSLSIVSDIQSAQKEPQTTHISEFQNVTVCTHLICVPSGRVPMKIHITLLCNVYE